MQYIIGKEDK